VAEYQTFGGEQLLTFTIPQDTEEVIDYGLNSLRPDETAVIYGPDSKLREQLTDMRNGYAVFTTGLLLGAHPVISSALTNPDSYFYDDKWGRLKSSAEYIVPLADGNNAVPRARAIGKIHRKIFGFDRDGNRHSALFPPVWTFAHLAIMSMVERKMDNFDAVTYSGEYRDDLYQEERVLYGCYGVSDECLSQTRQEYETEFPKFCREELYRTQSIEETLGMIESGKIDRPPQALEELWSGPAEGMLAWAVRILATGGLEPEMQVRLGAKWDMVDQAAYGGLKQLIKNSSRVMPSRMRIVPQVSRTVCPPKNLVDNFLCSFGEIAFEPDYSRMEKARETSGQLSRRELVRPVVGTVFDNSRRLVKSTFERRR
jgi:uncharacterized protein (DUF2236 family)